MASNNQPQPSMTTSTSVPLKRRRITRACDRCHRASLKCAPGPTPQACHSCASYNLTCTYNRPCKRRGPPARSQSQPRNPVPVQLQQNSPTYGVIVGTQTTWEYSHVADAAVIEYLVDQYHQIVYPILLYFHWPSFSADIAAKRYMNDRSFFTLTMAVCATASTRLPNGLPEHLLSDRLKAEGVSSLSGLFYTVCLNALPALNTDDVEFNFMHTEALLGMLCLEYNNIRGCHAHLHRYLAMCAEIGFNDESQWPSNLSAIEVQERRRLFWQQYHFDVYLATLFGSCIRQRGQSQCNVLYPAEVFDDADITEAEVQLRGEDQISFIRGWNFVTDLYRVLEQYVEKVRFRSSNQYKLSSPVDKLLSRDCDLETWTVSEVLKTSQDMYDALPQELRQARPTTGARYQDRYGFQAINATITLTTVKMVLAQTQDHSVSQLCTMAGGFLDELSAIPTAYIRSTSTAMIHHLAGVGNILGHAITAPLSQWTYLQARSALLALADLVSSLETAIRSSVGISSKLRDHVQRIDEYMTQAAEISKRNQVIHSAMPAAAAASQPSLPITDAVPQGLDTSVGRNQSPLFDDEYTLTRNVPQDPQPQPASNAVGPENPSSSTCDERFRVDGTLLNDSNPTVDDDTWQFQLPEELFQEWPFDIGQGDVFTFLGQGRDTQYINQ